MPTASDMRAIQIVEALGGLPPLKVHCSLLATGALKKAIEDYRRRHGDAADTQ